MKIFFVTIFCLSQTAFALTVEPMNIDQLTDRAGQVVSGTVISVTPQAEPGKIPVVISKISVEEMIKGKRESEVTIRQLGRVGPKKTVEVFPGLPRFRTGERVIIFLPGSSGLGLASPVGIGQGVFRLIGAPKKGSDPLIVNEFQNRALRSGNLSQKTQRTFKRLQLNLDAGRDLPLTAGQLKTLVRSRMGVGP